MDTSAQQNQNPQVENIPPWKRPHIPVTPQEMIGSQQANSGGKNYTLLSLASLLLLAGVIGITLFLFIQNKTSNSKIANTQNNSSKSLLCNNPKVYKSITEALKEPEKVCTLDLSFQKLSTLPADITKLKNLTSLYLTGNKFTQIPKEVFELKNLERLDVNTNQLTSVPKEMATLSNLQMLNLTNNNLKTLPREVIDMNLTSIMLHGNDKSLLLYEK